MENDVERAIDAAALALWRRTAAELHLADPERQWADNDALRDKYRGLVRLVVRELDAVLDAVLAPTAGAPTTGPLEGAWAPCPLCGDVPRALGFPRTEQEAAWMEHPGYACSLTAAQLAAWREECGK